MGKCLKGVTNPVEIRRELFEQEIDKFKRNVELIFKEYSRSLTDTSEYIPTFEEIKESRNLLDRLGKTYINADNLLRTKDDWADDVIEELETHNRSLREWIHRRENPDFDMNNSITILENRIFCAYQTTEHLVGSIKDAQNARIERLKRFPYIDDCKEYGIIEKRENLDLVMDYPKFNEKLNERLRTNME